MATNFKMPDPSNIQGLILRGYTHPFSCHLLFSFNTNGDTKSFFNDLYPKIQSAADWGTNKPVSMLNIGLSFSGIGKLGIVAAGDLGNFPATFQNGPWSGGSQASLADVCDPKSTPANWWNGNGNEVNSSLHCVIHAYALTAADLDTLRDFITTSAASHGITEIFPLAKTDGDGRLYQSILYNDPDKIHFGYTDGISEPALDNPGRSGLVTQADNSNFLIGYLNGSISQPGPFDKSTAGTFAKDGCYNAFRVIYQDVAAFNSFIKQQAVTYASQLAYLGLDEAGLEEWFAAKLCGRWRSGSPMILSPTEPEPVTNRGENFGYAVLDDPNTQSTDNSNDILSGISCPFSAHTRVANPRNQLLDTASEGSDGPPRILRRGMPYGPTLQSSTDDGKERGLIGMFLCGSLSGQFEKLSFWMNYNSFSNKPIFSVRNPPQDALLGNRLAKGNSNYPGVTTSFIIPIEGGNITIPALPQWLTTRGTAYCLLPSLASLAKIAGRS